MPVKRDTKEALKVSNQTRWLLKKGLVFVFLAMTVGLVSQTAQTVQPTPPFSGTIFLDPDIITPSDPTAFEGVSFAGRGSRTMFDRRVNNWVTVNAFLFDAAFDDGLSAEVQVNPEFATQAEAQAQAEKYGRFIGQLPTALRAMVETVWIHRGSEPFGGGNNNILIHTGQSDLYVRDGILEETLVHESSHTSLDPLFANNANWKAAQKADANYISTYAQDFPEREDIAETFLLWLAVRFRADRIPASLKQTIINTIPNRLAFFDAQNLDMYPIVPKGDAADRDGDGVPDDDDYCPDFAGDSNANGC